MDGMMPRNVRDQDDSGYPVFTFLISEVDDRQQPI